MTATLADLPFIYLYLRLDAAEPPLFRSKERGKDRPNQLVPEEFHPTVEQFGKAIAAGTHGHEGYIDFEGVRCRLTQQKMFDGAIWVCARRLNTALPQLNKLGFAPHIYNHLHGLGTREGLILISGNTVQGKTTTAAGLLVDFLQTYGGTAFAVEDTIEYVLKGRHGDAGQCFQVEAKTDEEWQASLRRGLRWAPRYIFVGEVSSPKVAEQLLHAATTGHTVITTLNAGAPEEALTGYLFLAEQAMGSGAAGLLAAGLTALLHQNMREEGPFIRYLFTEENAPGDPIRSVIREGKISSLANYIDRIAARLANQPGNVLPPLTVPTNLPPLPGRGSLPPLPKKS
jgi:twitching motility protein PilT